MMATKSVPKILQILGKQYTTDGLTNVTPKILHLIDRKLYKQTNNPLFLVSENIRHFFKDGKSDSVGYNYDEFNFDSPVVTVEDNFDSLLIPQDHVSRKPSDSYYVNSQNLLRCHSSAHQMHCLQEGSKAFISIADCYRRDSIDRSHYPAFHQCEIFKLYNRDHIGDAISSQILDSKPSETKTKQAVYSQEASSFAEMKLKSSIESFVKYFFNDSELKTRWVDAYFPFTHPSFELEILWNEDWLEVLGCGVVRDEILRNAGIQDHIGFAAGFGLERFAMLKYRVPDIRLFWSRDSGFTHQFEDKSAFDAIKFKPFSSCPQCINDLAFWLPRDEECEYCPNDFYDVCRDIGGDLVEQVTLIDEFVHPKTGRKSNCFRIVYRAADRALTKDEVNVIHNRVAEVCRDKFRVEIR